METEENIAIFLVSPAIYCFCCQVTFKVLQISQRWRIQSKAIWLVMFPTFFQFSFSNNIRWKKIYNYYQWAVVGNVGVIFKVRLRMRILRS